MLKKGIVSGIGVFGLLALLFLLVSKQDVTTQVEKNIDDNPTLRAEWEKSRLLDPQTGEIPFGIRLKEMAYAKTLPKVGGFSSFSRNENDSLVYVRRGPHNVGGRTRAFAVDLTSSSTLFAGGVSGGLWRSTNFGTSWDQVTPKDEALSISCIVQDPRAGKKDTWYIGTGEGRGSLNNGGLTIWGTGMYKSTDKGITWTPIASTQETDIAVAGDWGVIWRLAIDPSNTSEDEIYAAANGSIMKSTDGGTSWKKVLGGGLTSDANYTDVVVTSTGVVYAAMGKNVNQPNPGIWRSTDGETWINITGSVWPSNYERIVIDYAKSNENELICLARTPGVGAKADPTSSASNESSSLFKYTYISGDGSGTGGIWSNLSANIPGDQNAYYTFDTQQNYNMVVKFDPFNSSIIYIGSTNLFRSDDGFTTSTKVTQIGGYNPKVLNDPKQYRYPNQHPDQHDIFFQPNNSAEAFTATDGGVSYTNNIKATEVEWQFINTGYFTSQFYTVAIDHSVRNDVVLGGLQDNGTQFTSNQSVNRDWTDPLQSDGSYCAVEDGTLSDGSGVYYVSSQQGRTFKVRIDNTGETAAAERLEPAATNQFNRSANYSFINPFELDYADNNVMYMLFKNASFGPSKVKVHRTLKSIPINGGSSPRTDWSEINFTFPGVITALVSSRSNPTHRLYVGTNNGSMYRVENANTTTATVTKLGEIQGVLKGTYVSDFAVHPDDADKILVTFSNYKAYSIFYSNDGGDTWIPVAGNLEEPLGAGMPQQARGIGNGPSVRCAAMLETDNGTAYFVGTSVGLFATNELNGDSTIWSQQSPDLIGNAVIEKFDTRDSDNYLAIATHGNGVFGVEVTDSELIGVEEADVQIADVIGIYPNPNNGIFKVDLSTSTLDFNRITVLDQLGRIVMEEALNQNAEVVELDNREFKSGVYYISLFHSKGKITKRFVVNK